MTDGIRTTDLGVASYRRLVYRNVIAAVKSVFDSGYDRETQLSQIKITQQYPLKKLDYPCVVIDFQDQRVLNAGVGHVEWFRDPLGAIRKWNHSRFEGMLNFNIHALSTLDRDILADAIVEMVRFGRLDDQLNRFYEIIYPEHTPPPPPTNPDTYWQDYNYSLFGQLMLDSDQLTGHGNSAQIAPWQPEDVLVYTTGYSVVLHGGYYNTNPAQDWSRVTRIVIDSYQTDQYGVELPFPGHAEIAWSPPFQFLDEDQVSGGAVISADEEHDDIDQRNDTATIGGVGVVSADEDFIDV